MRPLIAVDLGNIAARLAWFKSLLMDAADFGLRNRKCPKWCSPTGRGYGRRRWGLIHLGQTNESTPDECCMPLPGDDIVPNPQAVTNEAITIDAPPEAVWPWLVQMGWHRARWYTARWVDKLMFRRTGLVQNRIIPGLQEIHRGDFIPDGAPETKCGFIVERLEQQRTLALHSTPHLPASWRNRHEATLDWSWVSYSSPPTGSAGASAGNRRRQIWVTAEG
jgi:hypothetical protein